jgi:uncharacterized GH25 family protein
MRPIDRRPAAVPAPGTRTAVRVLLALLLTACAAAPAVAHQYWLAPERYDARPHEPVGVAAFAGTGFRGEAKPWSPGHCVRFVARTSCVLDLSRAGAPGETTWARFAPADDGGALLAYESDWTPIALAPELFDAYLVDEGLSGPLAVRQHAGTHGPGRERYRRCAKTWLAGRDPARATTPLGLPLEIVPLALPGSAATLRVRLLWNGEPLPGVRVKAWRSPVADGGAPLDAAVRDSIGMSFESATDARGEVSVPCAAPGEWLLSAVTMRPCGETAVADWESTWASLTFARLPKPRAGR